MIDEFKMGEIKATYKLTNSIRATSMSVGVSRQAVADAVSRRFKVSARAPRAPSKKLVQRRKLLRKIATEQVQRLHRIFPRFGSARKIKLELLRRTGENLSVRHIRRELQFAGLKAYKRPSVPTRKRCELSVKRAFCKRRLCLPVHRIVFSDESWLTCNENTGKVQWCKAREDVLPMEQKSRFNVPSIMVWAAVGVDFKSQLIIFPSKREDDGVVKVFRLDSAAYIRRCLSSVSEKLVREKKIFQQDGARSHIAKPVRAYFARKKIEWIDDWPPYCPDLNMIEPLWKELNERVGAKCPMSQEELIAAAKEAWKEMPQSLINAHCKHFRTVLRNV